MKRSVLLSPGSVVTSRVLQQSGPRLTRSTSKAEFVGIVNTMDRYGKTLSFRLPRCSSKCVVFVKKEPALLTPDDLKGTGVSHDTYRTKYECNVQRAAVGKSVMQYLMKEGYLPSASALEHGSQ